MTCEKHGGNAGNIVCRQCDAETIQRSSQDRVNTLDSLHKLAHGLARWDKKWPRGTIFPAGMERACNAELDVLCTLAAMLVSQSETSNEALKPAIENLARYDPAPCDPSYNGKPGRMEADTCGEWVRLADVRAALESVPPVDPLTEHPEATCEECGRPNVTWFAPNPIWNAAAPPYGFICPLCFIKHAETAGINKDAWRLAPEFYEEPKQ